MDGIQSWSSFEERQKNCSASRPEASSSIFTSDDEIDALYVSSSSPNIAPAAAALLKNTGLSGAPSSSDKVTEIEDDRHTDYEGGKYEEFRLKFHWMRPHPSLVFSVEDEFLTAVSGSKVDNDSEQLIETHKSQLKYLKGNPAIESSRLMEAYRSSQMRKCLTLATESDCNNNTDAPDDKLLAATNMHTPADDVPKNAHPLPMEFPKFRINLANLIEPPLMTSWLPGGGSEAE